MKQIVVRIGALAVVVSLGVIAIAQAQRGDDTSNDPLGQSPSVEGNTLRGDPPLPDGPSSANPLREEMPGADDPSGVLLAGEPQAAEPPRPAPNELSSGEFHFQPNPTRPDYGAVADDPPSDPFGGGGQGYGRNPVREGYPLDQAVATDPAAAGGPVMAADYREELRLADASAATGFDRDTPASSYGRRGGNGAMASASDRATSYASDTASDPRGVEPAILGNAGGGFPGAGAMPGDSASDDPDGAMTSIDSPSAGGSERGRFPRAEFPAEGEGQYPAQSQPEGTGQAHAEGTGRPGADSLEGPQVPQVTIQKIPPTEMRVGKPATFTVKVRNTGAVAAANVEIVDQVPRGTRLTGTTPRASQSPQGELVWAIGTLQPGDEETVSMQLMPTDEGEIGSVATVHFSAAASAKVKATRAELIVETSAPGKVLIGEPLVLKIELSNPGSGPATGVTLAERIPPSMGHPAGGDLEYEIGTLGPGESRTLELEMLARQPGPVENVLTARGDGNLRGEHRIQWEVIAPQLQVNVAGSRRRFLEREAVYELAVSNPGTAPADQVELVAHLPEGLKFVSANNAGHYDEASQAVYWRLEELPVRESGTVELVTMPVQSGDYELAVESSANGQVEVAERHPVRIEGIAAIMYEVRDVTDPIQVGGETLYEIRVLNQGSKASSNVRLAIDIPPEMEFVSAEGPTRHALSGRQILFDGLARLAPKADTTYRVRVRGIQPGDLRLRVQLLTDEMRGIPVTKEESTRVYSDQ